MTDKKKKDDKFEEEIDEAVAIGNIIMQITSEMLDESTKIELPEDKDELRKLITCIHAELDSLIALSTTYSIAVLRSSEKDKKFTRALAYSVVSDTVNNHQNIKVKSPSGTMCSASDVINGFMRKYLNKDTISEIKDGVMEMEDKMNKMKKEGNE